VQECRCKRCELLVIFVCTRGVDCVSQTHDTHSILVQSLKALELYERLVEKVEEDLHCHIARAAI